MFFWDSEYEDVRLERRLAAFEDPEPCEYGPDVYGELDESYLEDLGPVEVDLATIRGSAIKQEWPSIDDDACQHFLTLWTDGEWDNEQEAISVLEVGGDYWVTDGHSRYVVKNAVNPEGTIMANVKRRIPVEAAVQGPSGQSFAPASTAERRMAQYTPGAVVDWHGDRGVISRVLDNDVVEVRMVDSNEKFFVETPFLTVIGHVKGAQEIPWPEGDPNAGGRDWIPGDLVDLGGGMMGIVKELDADGNIATYIPFDEWSRGASRRTAGDRYSEMQSLPFVKHTPSGKYGEVVDASETSDYVEVSYVDGVKDWVLESDLEIVQPTEFYDRTASRRTAQDDIGVGTVIHHLATGKTWTITGFDPETDYWLTDQGPAWTNNQLRNNIMKGIYTVDPGGMSQSAASRQTEATMESFSCNDRIRESATGRCGEIMALDETGEFGDISWDDGDLEENVGLIPGQFTKYGDEDEDEPRLFDPRPAGRNPRRRVLDRPTLGPTVVAAHEPHLMTEDHAVVNFRAGQRVLVASIEDLGLPPVEATLERLDADGWATVRTAEGREEVPVEALRKQEAGWDEVTRYSDIPINPGDKFQLYSGGDRYLTVVAVDPFTGGEDDTVTLDDSDGGVTVEPRGYLEDRIHEGIWVPVSNVDTSYVDMAQMGRRRTAQIEDW